MTPPEASTRKDPMGGNLREELEDRVDGWVAARGPKQIHGWALDGLADPDA